MLKHNKEELEMALGSQRKVYEELTAANEVSHLLCDMHHEKFLYKSN